MISLRQLQLLVKTYKYTRKKKAKQIVLFIQTYYGICKILFLLWIAELCRQPYHPAAQDWLPTEAKQVWAWSVPGWETNWEN